ncbi:hypothetical protein CKO19_16280, partial [Rhodovulum adriaticum]|nr:hypothetical protein [Rhodovulum adriaticum]
PDTAPRAPIAQDAATAPEKTGFTGIRPKPGTSDSAVAALPQVEKTDAPTQPWPKQPKIAALAPKPEKRAADTLLAKVGKGGQRLAAAGKGMPAPAETLRSATRLAHRARTSVTGAIGQARQEIAALATRLPDRLPLKPQRPATPSKPRAGQPRLPKLGDTLTRASAALQRQIGRDGAAPALGQPGPGDRKTPPQSAAAPAPKPTQKAPTAPAPKPADPLKREANPKAPGAVVPPAPRDEAEALTVFGARRTGAALQPRQRIRPALMGGVAVLAFAGVAGLWALFFLGQDAPTDSPPQIAALPEQPPVPRPQETLIAPPPVDIAETPVQPRVPLSPEQAAESYAATGLWQRAPEPPLPPTEGRIDALYLPRPDSAILPPEKVALPDPAVQRGNDTPPSPQTTARGGAPVVAMPAATEPPADAPQIAVTAGPPPVVPPDRPAAVLGPTPPDGAVRPRLRPAELAPAIPEDTAQPAAALPAQAEPDTGAEPDIRPADRPDALLPPAEDTQATETPEDEAAAETPDAPSSELALARSPLPRIRPAQLSEELAALAPAVPAAAAATAPSIPTSASVAKQATVPSAINLRKVSLIGVYGTESDRRALVRLPTGQYVKVQVGDNIDGGQVAAIGADSLRYIKAGRSQLLELPGG